jgi:CRISPR/Cas system endoribonuclease Cas6 (RAMP superfamily)
VIVTDAKIRQPRERVPGNGSEVLAEEGSFGEEPYSTHVEHAISAKENPVFTAVFAMILTENTRIFSSTSFEVQAVHKIPRVCSKRKMSIFRTAGPVRQRAW